MDADGPGAVGWIIPDQLKVTGRPLTDRSSEVSPGHHSGSGLPVAASARAVSVIALRTARTAASSARRFSAASHTCAHQTAGSPPVASSTTARACGVSSTPGAARAYASVFPPKATRREPSTAITRRRRSPARLLTAWSSAHHFSSCLRRSLLRLR